MSLPPLSKSRLSTSTSSASFHPPPPHPLHTSQKTFLVRTTNVVMQVSCESAYPRYPLNAHTFHDFLPALFQESLSTLLAVSSFLVHSINDIDQYSILLRFVTQFSTLPCTLPIWISHSPASFPSPHLHLFLYTRLPAIESGCGRSQLRRSCEFIQSPFLSCSGHNDR